MVSVGIDVLPGVGAVSVAPEGAGVHTISLVAGRTRWHRWNPLTHASFLGRAAGPNEYSGLVGPGLTCLPSHLITLRNLLTCPSFAELVYPIASSVTPAWRSHNFSHTTGRERATPRSFAPSCSPARPSRRSAADAC